MVLVGQPLELSYVEVLKELKQAMEDTWAKLNFSEASKDHRRGEYPNILTRISYGGRSKVNTSSSLRQLHSSPGISKCPGDIALGSKRTQFAIKDLEGHRGMARVVGFVKSKSVRHVWPPYHPSSVISILRSLTCCNPLDNDCS